MRATFLQNLKPDNPGKLLWNAPHMVYLLVTTSDYQLTQHIPYMVCYAGIFLFLILHAYHEIYHLCRNMHMHRMDRRLCNWIATEVLIQWLVICSTLNLQMQRQIKIITTLSFDILGCYNISSFLYEPMVIICSLAPS